MGMSIWKTLWLTAVAGALLRVLVKVKEAKEKTEGTILFPANGQTKPQGGEVVDVREGLTVGKNQVEINVKTVHKLCIQSIQLLRWNVKDSYKLEWQ